MENKTKKNVLAIIPSERIVNKIFLLRNKKIMLDRDLAKLYDVKTIRLREQVKRNPKRFPEDFMFQLTKNEALLLVSQNAIPSKRSLGGYLPYAFTEQGVAMLSSVLNSERAILVSVQIIRTFIKLKELLTGNKILSIKIEKLEKKFEQHDIKIKRVFDVLKQLLIQESKPKTPMGFRTK